MICTVQHTIATIDYGKLTEFLDKSWFSGVGHQPLVVLSTVQGQVVRVCAVVAHVSEWNSARGEARTSLLAARAFVQIVTDVDERELLETDIGSVEFFCCG
jgi:hypothetical protein